MGKLKTQINERATRAGKNCITRLKNREIKIPKKFSKCTYYFLLDLLPDEKLKSNQKLDSFCRTRLEIVLEKAA